MPRTRTVTGQPAASTVLNAFFGGRRSALEAIEREDEPLEQTEREQGATRRTALATRTLQGDALVLARSFWCQGFPALRSTALRTDPLRVFLGVPFVIDANGENYGRLLRRGFL